MSTPPPHDPIAGLVRRAAHVYTEAELRQRIEAAARAGRPLRVKLGLDPTSPDIHLGHTVVLSVMRAFQDLGHKAVLIIGDFTARIGDPTGRSKTRPVLTDAEIDHNAETYLAQAGKVLDLAPDKLELRRNGEWLGGMGFVDVLKLAGRMTVGQMLKREDFKNRFDSETPIGVHEFLYPLMQGWDSVMVRADVELGGTDQTYNNLVGRDLQQQEGQPPQVVMVMPLLRGLDGVAKMSKTSGNTIGVNEAPRDLFGKTMSIPDDLLEEWFRLLTDVPEDDYRARIAAHPRDAKDFLARSIGTRFHGPAEMEAAAQWWRERFGGQRKVDAVDVRIPAEERDGATAPAWKLAWLAHEREISKGEAKRMVQNGAFEVNGEKIADPQQEIELVEGRPFKAGRHRKGERIKQPLIGVMRLEP